MGVLKSKKVWATAIGIVVSIVGHFKPELQEVVQQVLYSLMAYVVGQGIADVNKPKPSV
jgi:hypothetical protein